jgi:hypothetical protein
MFLQRSRAEELQRTQVASEQDRRREDTLNTARNLAIAQAQDPESSFAKTIEFLTKFSTSPADHLLVDALKAEHAKTKKRASAAETQGLVPGVQAELTADRAQGAGRKLPFDPSKIVPGQQRNVTQEVPGLGREAVLQRLRFLDYARSQGAAAGLPVSESENARAVMQQLQMRGADPESMREIAVAEQKSRFGSVSERHLNYLRGRGLLTAKQEAEYRTAMLNMESYGRVDTSVNLTINDYFNTMNGVANSVEGLEVAETMLDMIGRDETAAGFSARIRDAIDRTGGVIEGFASVFSPGIAGELGTALGEFETILQSGDYEEAESKGGQKMAARFLEIMTDDTIPRLDMLTLLLAFKLESAATGSRRFSIQAVNRFYKMINLRDARGAGAVRARLGIVESMFRKRVKRADRDIAVLNKLVTKGPTKGQPVFPSPGMPPQMPGGPRTPRPEITITPEGKAIPYRPGHQTSR